MGRWTIIDINNNSYNMADETFRIQEAQFQIESNIIERSYRDGADLIGVTRVKSRKLPFVLTVFAPDETTYIATMNLYLMWLRKAVYIYDTVKSRRAKVHLDSQSVKYIDGSFNLMSENTINFIMLESYWEDYTENHLTQLTNVTNTNQTIVNNGWIDMFPRIVFTNTVNTGKLLIYVLETLSGIAINDIQFGSASLQTMEIDCANGTVLLSGLDRKEFIRQGTGFFRIPPGTYTLVIQSALALATVDIYYRQKYWV
jgi:hypothetical protein